MERNCIENVEFGILNYLMLRPIRCWIYIFNETYWWLVFLVFFASKFREVVETYEWYFVILWIQVQWWGYHELVRTLKPYLMQKNLFELFALTGDQVGDEKASFMSAHNIGCAQATWWNFHYVTFSCCSLWHNYIPPSEPKRFPIQPRELSVMCPFYRIFASELHHFPWPKPSAIWYFWSQ